MNYQKVAKEIVFFVGGKENIESVTHCITRLRFNLKDNTIPNKGKLENLDGVISIVESMGQFQVVIGNKVNEVYEQVIKIIGENEDDNTSPKKGNYFNKIIQTFSSIFTPIIPALAGAGMIIGILEIFSLIFNDFKNTDTYIILSNTADAVFYFMPIFLGYTSGKTFKANPFVGMIIGAALVHPEIVSILDSNKEISFLGLSITHAAYASSVIPIVIAIFILSYVERFLKKYVPDAVELVVVPALSLLIVIPATLLVFGPIGTYIGSGLSIAYNSLGNLSSILSGALIGGLWGVFVIFGGHRAIVPIGLNDLASSGKTTLFSFTSAADLSQSGAALGVYLKTKNTKLKTVSMSACITALFGVTEPAIYGVNLRFKKPFIFAVISGSLAGGFIGWGGSYATTFANQGILSIAPYTAPGLKLFTFYIIGLIIAFFGSAILTYFFGFKDEKSDNQKNEDTTNNIKLNVPVKGEVTNIKNVNDNVFSSESLGKGMCIKPSEGMIYAPDSGVVSLVFPTLHSICLKLDNKIELLIHIGINTVELKGEFFKTFVEEGQRINKGDELISFNINKIKERGYDLSSAIIVTNSSDFNEITVNNKVDTNLNDIGLILRNRDDLYESNKSIE